MSKFDKLKNLNTSPFTLKISRDIWGSIIIVILLLFIIGATNILNLKFR